MKIACPPPAGLPVNAAVIMVFWLIARDCAIIMWLYSAWLDWFRSYRANILLSSGAARAERTPNTVTTIIVSISVKPHWLKRNRPDGLQWRNIAPTERARGMPSPI